MAFLETNSPFDPDSVNAPVVGIRAFHRNHDSGMHQHNCGQLMLTLKGSTRITLDDQLCLLPPMRAAWIPAGVRHRCVIQQAAEYRSVYLNRILCVPAGDVARMIEVSPLLCAVLESMTQAPYDTDWSRGKYAHLLGLFLIEIAEAPRQPFVLQLPQDKRLAPLLAHLDRLPPNLQTLVTRVGASGKTIHRIFLRETGMGYQQWRQQWRLMRCIELLATGHSLDYCAFELGFSNNSVLIAFFKSLTGTTPRNYLKKSVDFEKKAKIDAT
ncbi:AraC family transcriptional regulator [Pseudomonas sp. MDT1-85]